MARRMRERDYSLAVLIQQWRLREMLREEIGNTVDARIGFTREQMERLLDVFDTTPDPQSSRPHNQETE